MRGAGDAGFVIADGLLTLPGERLPRQRQALRNELPEVILDALLVLRCRRHVLGVEDGATVVEPVAVIQDAARRFGAAVAGGGVRRHGDGRRLRPLLGVDEAQGLVAGMVRFPLVGGATIVPSLFGM